MPGQPFSLAGGPSGKHGMLHVVLKDRLSGQTVIFASTHLKAKGGEVCNRILHAPNYCISAVDCALVGSDSKHLQGIKLCIASRQ
jgi:hypothetical protein